MPFGEFAIQQLLDQIRRSHASDIADQVNSGLMPPQDALIKYAQATGDPEALKAGLQQSALAKINTGNSQVNQILPWLAPNDVVGAITNPLLMQGAGATPSFNQSPNAVPTSIPAAPTQTQSPANDSQGITPKPSGLNYQYLNTQVPPFYRNQVLDSIQGGELAKDMSPRDRTLMSNWAHNVDPSFTETKGTLRNKMAIDIASNAAGSQGGQAQQLNSVMGHLYDLNEAAPALQNDSSYPVNSFRNFMTGITNSSAFPQISQYRAILERASPELNKFYVGGEGDKEGRASAKQAFADDLPTNVIQNNVKTQIGLLNSKANALQTVRDRIMGNATSPVLNPLSEALIADIKGSPLTPQQQALVNAHRKESNLPPKTWPVTAPAGYSAMSLPQPPSAPAAKPTQAQQIDLSKITPKMARAELARRRAAKQ